DFAAELLRRAQAGEAEQTRYTQDFGPIEAKFSAFGRNILNDRGIGGNLPVAGLFSFAGLRPPQQFGGEVQIKF
ncbi:MAG: hypothetical protein AAGD40_12055, partial [Pseudomonadota bacterium]